MNCFKENITNLISQCEEGLSVSFKRIDQIAAQNFERIIKSMQRHKLAARHFSGTTGYGYDDGGRDLLNLIFADAFESEAALVSPSISSGTQAITTALFAVLRPNDRLLSVSGAVYDTLHDVIVGEGNGSLKDFGIKFSHIDLIEDDFDFEAIEKALIANKIKMVMVQRSRGYSWRRPLTLSQIELLVNFVKKHSPDTVIFIDNCYGEFVDNHEPPFVGADLVAGSLIKNPGGGIAPTGGYIAGRKDLVDLAAKRLTAPSTGGEIGSYYAGYLPFFQGLFQAPHVVAQALKGGMLFSSALTKAGYETLPREHEKFDDIICSVRFHTKEELIAFCQAVQFSSPVDSFVSAEPWDMPGYTSKVIMAAGCFVQGSSIELSCDAPIREPYIVYLQGGLHLEHIKFALAEVLRRLEI